MKVSHLKGRRYVNLIRCSKDEQADTSPKDQAKVLHEYAAEHGMLHAGEDIVLEGISGSAPADRTDIELIISRKRARNDFDILLVQDFSRLTRGGVGHGSALQFDLATEGIEVVFVMFTSTGDVDTDAIMQTMGFFAAQQAAKALSNAGVRGLMSSLAAGNIPHSIATPYGVDRAYFGLDGTLRHRVRNLADGRQQMLHPTDEIVLRTFPANPKKGASPHYKRQSDEQIQFVPGAPERVEIVRRIFREHLVDGDGAYRIAKRLNNEGIPSYTGKLWGKDSVTAVLRNSTYTGVGTYSRYATGIYNVLGANATPKAVKRDLTTIAKRKKSQKEIRPRDEWKFMVYPALANYLGEIRELAVELQGKEFERQNSLAMGVKAPKQKPGGDKHVESPFVLKDVLHSRQGNHPMTGRTSGSPKKPIRYYGVSRGLSAPKDGSPLARMIPAEPLEQAVLAVVKEVLGDLPNLRQEVLRKLDAEQKARTKDNEQLQPLIAEQAELQSQIADAMTAGPSIRKMMKAQFDAWEAKAAALEIRISKAQAVKGSGVENAQSVVDVAIKQFRAWSKSLDGIAPSALRKILGTLVARLEIDLETREVVMELALPEGLKTAIGRKQPMCFDEKAPWFSINETHRSGWLKIAVFTCEGTKGQREKPSCFTCRRKAA